METIKTKIRVDFPKTLKIGAHRFDVVTYKNEVDGSVGESELSKNILKIDINQHPTAILVTLFHELNHCINSETSHEVVEFHAQAYAQVFKDNPDLLKSIKKLIQG